MLDVLWASEALVPAAGGAERTTLNWLRALTLKGHRVRALGLAGPPVAEAMAVPDEIDVRALPAPAGGAYWARRAAQREALGAGVAAALAERRASVVVGHQHAAPGVLGAAAAAGVSGVLVMYSYESLCKHAFDPASTCLPESGCARCPVALELEPGEREALLASRRAHAAALRSATAIVVPSRFLAAAVERWCERRPSVVAPVLKGEPEARARFGGPVVLAANRWTAHKGLALLPALARAAPRPVRVTRRGLDPATEDALRAAGATVVDNAPIGELLEGAAVLLVPSQWEEPSANIAWEALSAGLPVLASRAGGMPEYVPPALVVEPRDDRGAWAAAMTGLLSEEAVWERRRREGRDSALALLATDPVARLEDVLVAAARM